MKFNTAYIIRLSKTLVKIAGVFLLIAILLFFVFRNALLNKAIERVSSKLERKFQITLHVQNAAFTGLTSVTLQHISMVPLHRDTILEIDTFETGIKFWYALIGDIRIKKIHISHGYLQLSKKNGLANFDVLFHPTDSATKTDTLSVKSSGKINFSKTIYKLIDGLLDRIPSNMLIQNFGLRIQDEDLHAEFVLKQLVQNDNQIEVAITASDNHSKLQEWKISGLADPGKKKADIHFYNLDSGKVIIPYISSKFNLVTGFDSIHIELDEVDMDGGVLHIKGQSGIANFLVNHPKISKKDVVVDNASVNYHFIIDENNISLDSTTSVTFNKVTFNPFVKLSLETDTVFSLSVNIPRMPAQHFISSLPGGLFTHFKGMEVSGEFEYRLDFVFNENHPKDLVFESNLRKYNLSILKYGEANLAKLNGEFTYVPMEKGRPQRPIFVGVSNPYFTPAEQISPYLQKCVLTTEDPSFFYHRGFIDEAFRQSIIKNIRQRKFARGASTISMQLVKNVFLTREKTMSRKMEEILLVYILENNRISSKQRMLEVYFNIIEWGPNVYGIGEASEFYFKKKPIQLNYRECLFLASIIPRPKGFMWRFDKEGKLKPFAERHFSFITKLMLQRNVLLPEDTLVINTPFEISGEAKSFIKIAKDSMVIDSIPIDENGILQQTDD